MVTEELVMFCRVFNSRSQRCDASSLRRRQHGSPKRRYPTTTTRLHNSQDPDLRFAAVKTSYRFLCMTEHMWLQKITEFHILLIPNSKYNSPETEKYVTVRNEADT